MYCPKCKTEVEKDQLFCHVCGAELREPIKKKPGEKTFSEEAESSLPEISSDEGLTEEEIKSDDVSAEEPKPDEGSESEAEAEDKDNDNDGDKNTYNESEEETKQEETQEENEVSEPENADKIKSENSNDANRQALKQAEKPVQKRNNEKSVKRFSKESKKIKKYTAAMKAIVCVCAAVMLALAVVSKTTDFFKNDSSDKTMVLSGMSDSQKASFESFVSKFSPLFENGYDSSKTVFDDIIYEMNPSIENGLYVSFFGKDEPVSEADPAGRFKSDNEEVSYYAVEAKKISEIAQSLSLEALDDTNTMDCYYLDGKYYFSSLQPEANSDSYSVKVADAKKTSDDSFYITCDLFKNGSEEIDRQIYFIANNEPADSENWVLNRISNEALYSPLGSKLSENKEGTAQYIMKSRSIEAKTSDGKLYAEYIVQYPSFESDVVTAETSNSQYTQLINSYKKEASNADKLYAKYIEDGGNEADLPLYTHVVASVKYNDNNLVSIVERKTVYNPLEKSDAQEDTGAQSNIFADTSYEAHSFDMQTGEFLKKDDLTGKDYQKAEQTLFEKWIGYEEPEDVVSPQRPTDINSVGHAIYTSAWYVTGDTVNFIYQHEDGVPETVSIPIAEQQSEKAEGTT